MRCGAGCGWEGRMMWVVSARSLFVPFVGRMGHHSLHPPRLVTCHSTSRPVPFSVCRARFSTCPSPLHPPPARNGTRNEWSGVTRGEMEWVKDGKWTESKTWEDERNRTDILRSFVTYVVGSYLSLLTSPLGPVLTLHILLSISLRSVNEENGERNEKEMERIMWWVNVVNRARRGERREREER